MDTPMQKLQKKYDHALDAMWKLFNYGRNREELLYEELQRIKAICMSNRGTRPLNELQAAVNEIEGICDRGLAS